MPQLHTLNTPAPDAPNLFPQDKPIDCQNSDLKTDNFLEMEVGELCIILDNYWDVHEAKKSIPMLEI